MNSGVMGVFDVVHQATKSVKSARVKEGAQRTAMILATIAKSRDDALKRSPRADRGLAKQQRRRGAKMSSQTVSVTLPEPLYQRVCETAKALTRSIQDVLTESIALSLPPLEADLPATMRADLGPLALLSTQELQEIAHGPLAAPRQARLEELAEQQKKQPLDDGESSELDQLIEQAQRLMLRRAEARRLLVLRGYELYPKPAIGS